MEVYEFISIILPCAYIIIHPAYSSYIIIII